jgi:hypothetical protein
MTYLPPLQAVFATEAVPLFDGVLIVGSASCCSLRWRSSCDHRGREAVLRPDH